MKPPTKNTTGIHPRPGYVLVEVIRSEDKKPVIILPQSAQRERDDAPFAGEEDIYILEHNPGDEWIAKIPCGTLVLIEPEEQILIPSLKPRVICIVDEKYVKATVEPLNGEDY